MANETDKRAASTAYAKQFAFSDDPPAREAFEAGWDAKRDPLAHMIVELLRDYSGDCIVSMSSHMGMLYVATAHGRIWRIDVEGRY